MVVDSRISTQRAPWEAIALQSPRELRVLWAAGACMAALIWACRVPGVGSALYLGLSLYALLGIRQSLQALSLSVVVSFLNPALFVLGSLAPVLKWLVLLCAAFRVGVDAALARWKPPRCLAFLVGFCLVVLAESLAVSYDVAVSVSKLTSFFLGAATVLLAFWRTRHLHDYWRDWFFTLYTVVLLSSLPLLASSAGFARNARGFQGILNHPQAFGAFLAPLLALVLADALSQCRRVRLVHVAALLGAYTLVASGARTAAAALVLGGGLSLLTSLRGLRSQILGQASLLRSRLGALLLLALLSLALLRLGSLQQSVVAFLMKGGQHRSLLEAYDDTRGALIRTSWANFRERPTTGIGFGVASDASLLQVHRDPFMGIPIGASVEKGFLPAAVLEETGIIGAAMLLLLISALATAVVGNRGTLYGTWVFWTCLLVNFGEMVFFSLGGLGLHVWLLIGLMALPRERTQKHGSLERQREAWTTDLGYANPLHESGGM